MIIVIIPARWDVDTGTSSETISTAGPALTSLVCLL